MSSGLREPNRCRAFVIDGFSHSQTAGYQMVVSSEPELDGPAPLTIEVKCDTLGNVYAGCGDGLHIWSKQYSHIVMRRRVADPIRQAWFTDRQDVSERLRDLTDALSVLGFSDGNVGAGCANFCLAPGGRIVCLSEDRIYLISGLDVEGASSRG